MISYLRKGVKQIIVCVHNFTPNYFSNYFIRLISVRSIKEVMNTDREEFGGSGKINPKIEKTQEGFSIQLAPLATMIFEVTFDDKK